MDATVGMQLGRYLLRQRLGTGGMASVWRAVDERGRAVVVKRILPTLQSDADFVAMFEREATLSARMRHRNVVRVLDHGTYEGERYLVMEELHGRDLGTTMMELVHAAMPPPGLGAFVARELARALAYVHTLAGADGAPLGLIHRDVSLSNVMLCFDGTVKLLDFGVAKRLADEHSQRTQAGILKGKWAYLAPEQVEGGAVDQRADLFALGIVLWEMLTGRRLFKAATGLETLDKVRAAHVLPPSTLNAAVPRALDAICLRALAKAPADRFASAAELAMALDDAVMTLGFGPRALAEQMAALFAREAAAFVDSQQTTPVQRVDAEALDEPSLELASTLEIVPARAPAAVPSLDAASTVERVRVTSTPSASDAATAVAAPPRRPGRSWLLLVAVLAAAAGGLTGRQIAHARAGSRAHLHTPPAQAPQQTSRGP